MSTLAGLCIRLPGTAFTLLSVVVTTPPCFRPRSAACGLRHSGIRLLPLRLGSLVWCWHFSLWVPAPEERDPRDTLQGCWCSYKFIFHSSGKGVSSGPSQGGWVGLKWQIHPNFLISSKPLNHFLFINQGRAGISRSSVVGLFQSTSQPRNQTKLLALPDSPSCIMKCRSPFSGLTSVYWLAWRYDPCTVSHTHSLGFCLRKSEKLSSSFEVQHGFPGVKLWAQGTFCDLCPVKSRSKEECRGQAEENQWVLPGSASGVATGFLGRAGLTQTAVERWLPWAEETCVQCPGFIRPSHWTPFWFSGFHSSRHPVRLESQFAV